MPLTFNNSGTSFLSKTPNITGPTSTGQWSFMWWWKRTGTPLTTGIIYSRPTTALSGKTLYLNGVTNKFGLSLAYAVGVRLKEVDSTEVNVWCCDCFSINSTDPTNNLPAWYRRNSSTAFVLSSLLVTESDVGSGSETSPGTDDFVLGGDGTLGWIGQLAHVQVWNRLLTFGEFMQAMNLPGSVTRGLSGYWPMWFLGECLNNSEYNCIANLITTDKTSAPPTGRYYCKMIDRTGSREGGTSYSPMDTASLTSGVAPLGIFFDVTDTDSGIKFPPLVNDRQIWEEFYYEWDFGDSTCGNWTESGRPKNKGYGYTASHVYENPGIYTVKLIVITNSGDILRYSQTITVTDPEIVYNGNTFYVADDGDDGDAGTELEPWLTFGKAMSEMFDSNGPRRILFKRGDSFTYSTYTTPSSLTGPFHFGAYGSGAKPVIASSTANAVFQVDQTCTDTRFVDLDLQGSDSGQAHRSGSQSLILRNDINNFDAGFSTSDAHGNKRYVFIVDNAFTNSARYNIFFDHGQNVAIMGNSFSTVTGPSGEHMIRTYITHSIIQHNTIDGGYVGKHQLKFVGYFPTGDPLRVVDLATEAVEFGVISFNIFRNPTADVDWMVVLGPTDGGKDERLENCTFENNYLLSDDQNQVMLMLNNRWVVARNNLFNGSETTTSLSAIRVTQRGVEPQPDMHFVYNNSFYSTSTGSFRAVQVVTGSTNTNVFNNLASAPNSGSATVLLDAGTGTINTTNLLTDSPGYTDPGNGDFTISAGSPARDTGTTLTAVRYDYRGISRPQGSTTDIGAHEYVA